MKVISPSSYDKVYNQAMDIESEEKTSSQGKKKTNDDKSTNNNNDCESKIIQELREDMMRMMEVKVEKESM